MENKPLSKLKDRVWTTGKIRMEAEQRRLTLKHQVDLTLNVLSVAALFTSILALVPASLSNIFSDTQLSIISIFASILVIVTSLVVTNYHLSDEAAQFHKCYLELQALYSQIETANENDYNKMSNMYNNILEKYLNHTALDYLYLKVSKNKDNGFKDKPSTHDFIIYALTKFSLPLFIIAICLFGIFLLIEILIKG